MIYDVEMRVTMTVNISVEATSIEEAKKKAPGMEVARLAIAESAPDLFPDEFEIVSIEEGD